MGILKEDITEELLGFVDESFGDQYFRACNLLAKDCCRAALADEGAERRPKMAVIAWALRSAMTN